MLEILLARTSTLNHLLLSRLSKHHHQHHRFIGDAHVHKTHNILKMSFVIVADLEITHFIWKNKVCTVNKWKAKYA